MKSERARPRQWLTLHEVMAKVKLSRSTILQYQALGKFPHSIKATDVSIRWDAAQIDEYMDLCAEGKRWADRKMKGPAPTTT